MFKTILGATAVGLGICIVAGTIIGVTANVTKQIYEKQIAKVQANKNTKVIENK